MSETDHDATPPPPKRAQFSLWFLLFVVPTITGLGIAIYTNWHQQARARADLAAHRAVLHEKIAHLKSEVALLKQVGWQIQRRADQWKSADAIVDHLKARNQREDIEEGVLRDVAPWPSEYNVFFLQADEKELLRLLQLIRKEYRECDASTRFTLLSFTARIPEYAPEHVESLAEDARRLVEELPRDDQFLFLSKVNQLRDAFHLADPTIAEERTP